jgi:hypothetical protein
MSIRATYKCECGYLAPTVFAGQQMILVCGACNHVTVVTFTSDNSSTIERYAKTPNQS